MKRPKLPEVDSWREDFRSDVAKVPGKIESLRKLDHFKKGLAAYLTGEKNVSGWNHLAEVADHVTVFIVERTRSQEERRAYIAAAVEVFRMLAKDGKIPGAHEGDELYFAMAMVDQLADVEKNRISETKKKNGEAFEKCVQEFRDGVLRVFDDGK